MEKPFAKRYRQIAPCSATAIRPSTSGATVQALVTVADAQGTRLTDRTRQKKTPVKKAKKDLKKWKTMTPTPEDAELPSPANFTSPIPWTRQLKRIVYVCCHSKQLECFVAISTFAGHVGP